MLSILAWGLEGYLLGVVTGALIVFVLTRKNAA